MKGPADWFARAFLSVSVTTTGIFFSPPPSWGEIPFIIGTIFFSIFGLIMIVFVITDITKPKFVGDGLLTLADDKRDFANSEGDYKKDACGSYTNG